MAAPNKKAPGGHYSGANPVPNIHKFMESLDAEKKNRDDKINREMKEGRRKGEPVSHAESEQAGVSEDRIAVTDPTTGREVQIENDNADLMKSVDNPKVSSLVGVMGGTKWCIALCSQYQPEQACYSQDSCRSVRCRIQV
jgi:hypothetical protein